MDAARLIIDRAKRRGEPTDPAVQRIANAKQQRAVDTFTHMVGTMNSCVVQPVRACSWLCRAIGSAAAKTASAPPRTVRFDLRVLGSWPSVTLPCTWMAVVVTMIRGRRDVDVCPGERDRHTTAQRAVGADQRPGPRTDPASPPPGA